MSKFKCASLTNLKKHSYIGLFLKVCGVNTEHTLLIHGTNLNLDNIRRFEELSCRLSVFFWKLSSSKVQLGILNRTLSSNFTVYNSNRLESFCGTKTLSLSLPDSSLFNPQNPPPKSYKPSTIDPQLKQTTFWPQLFSYELHRKPSCFHHHWSK